jgi:hypothetical protein
MSDHLPDMEEQARKAGEFFAGASDPSQEAPAEEPEPWDKEFDLPDLPEWLTKAEEAREDQERLDVGKRALISKANAEQVNRKLASLGIEPITPATIASNGEVDPAHLTLTDYEVYGVYATWDVDSQMVRLLVRDWDDTFVGLLPSRLLYTIADVAYARHEGPNNRPTQRVNLRAAALKGVLAGPGDTSKDAQAIVNALQALTAAFLYVGDNICGINDRP